MRVGHGRAVARGDSPPPPSRPWGRPAAPARPQARPQSCRARGCGGPPSRWTRCAAPRRATTWPVRRPAEVRSGASRAPAAAATHPARLSPQRAELGRLCSAAHSHLGERGAAARASGAAAGRNDGGAAPTRRPPARTCSRSRPSWPRASCPPFAAESSRSGCASPPSPSRPPASVLRPQRNEPPPARPPPSRRPPSFSTRFNSGLWRRRRVVRRCARGEARHPRRT